MYINQPDAFESGARDDEACSQNIRVAGSIAHEGIKQGSSRLFLMICYQPVISEIYDYIRNEVDLSIHILNDELAPGVSI